jgi:DNA repair protein RadC
MKSWTEKMGGAEFKIMRLQDASALDNKPTLDTPNRVADYIRGKIVDSLRYTPDVENFVVVLLNSRRRPIGLEVVSLGTLDTLLVHPREVFKPAIIMAASAIVLAHNHPSGDPTPSEADIKITRDLVRAGQLLKIEVLDHVILGDLADGRASDFVSLRELGYFHCGI